MLVRERERIREWVCANVCVLGEGVHGWFGTYDGNCAAQRENESAIGTIKRQLGCVLLLFNINGCVIV